LANKYKSEEAERVFGESDEPYYQRPKLGRELGNIRPWIRNVPIPTEEANGYGNEIEKDSLAVITE
jgi:hypothetical protein